MKPPFKRYFWTLRNQRSKSYTFYTLLVLGSLYFKNFFHNVLFLSTLLVIILNINPFKFSCRISRWSGFGGLEVSVLAFGTQVREFKPGRSRRIFRAKKSSARLTSGGKVKPSVPCRKFTACKRTQKWRGSRHFRQNSRQFLFHSFTFRCWRSLAWGEGHLVAAVGPF